MYCPKCGAANDDAASFCSNCGAQLKSSSEEPPQETSVGLRANTAALLCYVLGWVSGVVFLVLEQKNPFVRFHALQSTVTFGVLTVASAILSWIPIVGVAFSAIIGVLGFILWIVGMVKAGNGNWWKVPWAGDWVERQIGPHGV